MHGVENHDRKGRVAVFSTTSGECRPNAGHFAVHVANEGLAHGPLSTALILSRLNKLQIIVRTCYSYHTH